MASLVALRRRPVVVVFQACQRHSSANTKLARFMTSATLSDMKDSLVPRLIEGVSSAQNIINNINPGFVLDKVRAGATHPPDHPAELGELSSFTLPDVITGSIQDMMLGKALVDSWRKDGILQITFPKELQVLKDAMRESKQYFGSEYSEKSRCVDSQSFAGYIASGEELTDGIRDYSEIFTVTKDLSENDPRVQAKWPCHGPTPWPYKTFADAMSQYMDYQAEIGEKLLHLTALGLGLKDPHCLTKLTKDGWHHMRVLRFPPTNATNGKGKAGRGIGAHTDYGLLVIAAQDDVGGLFIRKPMPNETYENWKTSSAGMYENDSKWTYVPPMENVFTAFPGDMMQYMTNSYLPSTPHKVGLNLSERFAFAYFHEPNFNACIRPLEEFGESKDQEPIHYGTHFTNMFMRNYPERITAQRIHEEKRMDILENLRANAVTSFEVPGVGS